MKIAFDTPQALMFFIRVFTARPFDFISLAIWTIVFGSILGAAQMQALAPYQSAMMMVDQSDPEAMFAAYGNYFAGMAPYVAIGTVVSIIMEAAWLRLFVRGEGGGAFPYRLSADELFYLLNGVVTLLILLASYIVGSLVMGVLIGALALGGEVLAVIGRAVGVLLLLAMVAATLVLLSPVLALGVLRRSFQLGAGLSGAFKIFWSLLGSYVIALVGVIILYLVVFGLLGVFGIDQTGQLADGSVAGWDRLLPYYFIVGAVGIFPISMIRGIACYAALQIDKGVASTEAT